MKTVKRCVLLFICLVFFVPSASRGEETVRRGLFVSMIQKPLTLSSREAIAQLIADAKKDGVQTIFLQVYYGNRTFFASKIGDPSLHETYVKKLGEDPVALVIRQAHSAGLQVHAWLNLLSLSSNRYAPLLKEYGTNILTRNIKQKKTLDDYKIDNQFFLEPGDLRVRQNLALMLGELVRAYPDLDGVQFDYIRYPDVKPAYGYTRANIDRFKEATGAKVVREDDPAWKDWKRTQVTELVEFLAKRARSIRPGIQVSTTGCMPYARAYHEAFQDWPSWVNRGLVDFVTIMNYSPDPVEFERWIADVKTRVKDPRKVNIAVGAYRFINSPEIFVKEWGLCEGAGAGACVVFHYGSLFESPAMGEAFLKDKK